MADTTTDMVNHPQHYTQYKHEVIELTGQLTFKIGNAVKYVLRSPFKGAEEEDLRKAKWYVTHLDPRFDRVEKIDPLLVLSYMEPLVGMLVLGIHSACQERNPERAKKMYSATKASTIACLDYLIEQASKKVKGMSNA